MPRKLVEFYFYVYMSIFYKGLIRNIPPLILAAYTSHLLHTL